MQTGSHNPLVLACLVQGAGVVVSSFQAGDCCFSARLIISHFIFTFAVSRTGFFFFFSSELGLELKVDLCFLGIFLCLVSDEVLIHSLILFF